VKVATEVIDVRRIRLSFLVDAEAFTGALLCELSPGVESMMDIQATFIMRREIKKDVETYTGFAGLSSLFFQGAFDTPTISSDQAHDADVLVITFSDGSVTEFPLINPATLFSMDFAPSSGQIITAVALEQRDRNPAHYATFASADYASRSSLAIEQINASIPLKVSLQIFPTSSEFFDNVVAHLTLLKDLQKGDIITLAYRLRAF
jgi:glucan biosynthesis protein